LPELKLEGGEFFRENKGSGIVNVKEMINGKWEIRRF
jgi:hypothetical protein